jgi:tetratricopeptide (TPR) repeat protein
MAEVLQLLGVVDERRGDLAASRADLERALEILTEVAGQDDPARPGLLMELAVRAGQLGDQAAATRFADEGYAAAERVVGPDSPHLAIYAHFHAKAIGSDPAQLDRARASFERAIEISERVIGPQSFETASHLGQYAHFLWTKDLDADALRYAQRALPVYDAIPEPLAAARIQQLSGRLLLRLRRKPEARATLEDAKRRFAALAPDAADELEATEQLLDLAR